MARKRRRRGQALKANRFTARSAQEAAAGEEETSSKQQPHAAQRGNDSDLRQQDRGRKGGRGREGEKEGGRGGREREGGRGGKERRRWEGEDEGKNETIKNQLKSQEESKKSFPKREGGTRRRSHPPSELTADDIVWVTESMNAGRKALLMMIMMTMTTTMTMMMMMMMMMMREGS
eukprot:753275-Hanusia_phi.AAC.1